MDSAAISRSPTSLALSQKLRAWMILGRISNLPTVWSNCLAGCWLGGWNTPMALGLLCLGSTLLYVGGMFLNDVCDFKFDAEFRRERPIVTGTISRRAATIASTILFIAGIILISTINNRSGLLAIGLTLLIVTYDWSHKHIRTAPLLMAGCRFLLYLTAAAAGLSGITPRAVIFGAALGIYVTGLSYIARGESRPAPTLPGIWLLLFLPAIAGFVLHPSIVTALVSLPLILLIGWATIISRTNVGRAVALLLAGIVLVDLIAISTTALLPLAGFFVLFSATILFQRYIPAT
jgi:UbiA prenyltransferase family